MEKRLSSLTNTNRLDFPKSHTLRSNIGSQLVQQDQGVYDPRKNRRQPREINLQKTKRKEHIALPKNRTDWKYETDVLQITSHDVCPICIEELVIPYAKTQCGHNFCEFCLTHYTKESNNCPVCRAIMNSFQVGSKKVDVPVPVKKEQYYENEDYITTPCYYCGTLRNPQDLVLCDGCNNVCVHSYCEPQLRHMDPSVWLCIHCEGRQRSQ